MKNRLERGSDNKRLALPPEALQMHVDQIDDSRNRWEVERNCGFLIQRSESSSGRQKSRIVFQVQRTDPFREESDVLQPYSCAVYTLAEKRVKRMELLS